MAWRLATWPTRRSPLSVNATIEGVVRPPSALGSTLASLPSMMATTELVVPRSMPITLLIGIASLSGIFSNLPVVQKGHSQSSQLQAVIRPPKRVTAAL